MKAKKEIKTVAKTVTKEKPTMVFDPIIANLPVPVERKVELMELKNIGLKKSTLIEDTIDEWLKLDLFPNVKKVWVEITVEFATEALFRNLGNRKMSKATVRKYAEDILNSQWYPNGETIIFDEEGNLIQGQHRMASVIVAGKSMISLVVYGIPKDYRFTMDDVRARTVLNVMEMKGISDSREASYMTRMVENLYRYRENRCSKRPKTDLHVAADIYEKNPQLAKIIKYINEKIKAVALPDDFKRLMPMDMVASVYYMTAPTYPDLAEVFINCMITGESSEKDPNNQFKTLYAIVSSRKSKKKDVRPDEFLPTAMRAFYNVVKGLKTAVTWNSPAPKHTELKLRYVKY